LVVLQELDCFKIHCYGHILDVYQEEHCFLDIFGTPEWKSRNTSKKGKKETKGIGTYHAAHQIKTP
jgi:hypothetical protein